MTTKNKLLILTAITFFALINTSYFWEGYLGILSMPATLFLFLVFIILTIGILIQLYHLIKERFKTRKRIVLTTILILVVALTAFKPFGLIDFDKLKGEDLLVAYREGAANCRTTIKLKDNNKFYQRINCFGVSKLEGNYVIKGDTVFFHDFGYGERTKDFYEYAVIKKFERESINKAHLGYLSLFEHNNNSAEEDNFLFITKNLIKIDTATN